MWQPHSYDDVTRAVGVLTETVDLDFKRDVTTSVRDLAKDVAAMSLEGGVIVIGVDENAGMASALTPCPIAGTPERIQQVIDSRVRPPVTVQIDALRANPGDSDGVIVITIPPSSLAPHMVDNRFPARAGATTRYMEEAEVSRLYGQRASIIEAANEGPPMQHYVYPPGSETAGIRGIGRLRVLVRPLVPVQHPASPWLRSPLVSAVQEANESVMGSLISQTREPSTFDWLRTWRPRGSTGWTAGDASSDFAVLKQHKLAAAVMLHSGDFSFHTTIPLLSGDESFLCAYEHLWAAELLAQLSIAGRYFSDIPAASLLRCAISLEHLDGSVSYRVSHAQAITDNMVRVLDSVYSAQSLVAARDLAVDARAAVTDLLGPLFASFLDEGYDVIAQLSV